MFTIHAYTINQFSLLEGSWKSLQVGEDMTFFQTYDWYKMLIRKFPNDSSNYETRFFVVNDSEKPVMIAPLWIIKRSTLLVNKKGCYFFGRHGWTDYLNFIYRDFDSQAVESLMEFVAQEYGVHMWTLECMRESTESYEYLKKHYPFEVSTRTKCVWLKLPTTVDEYNAMLSKGSRQNIRTAQNRLSKDGIAVEVEYRDRLNVNYNECYDLRAKRAVEKNARIKQSLKAKIKSSIIKLLRFKEPQYFPLRDCPETELLTIKTDSKQLMAYFNYGIHKENKEAVVMAVGTDEQYKRYSPGILAMYNFIIDAIRNQTYACIDFTKGDERYKYALGGQDHYIQSFRFRRK